MKRNPPGQNRRYLRAKKSVYEPKPDDRKWCPSVWPRQAGDWTGRKVGKLRFIEPLFKCGKHWYYLVECDCGNDTVVRAMKGDAYSCGCRSTKSGYKPSEDKNSTWGTAEDDDLGAPVRGEFDRLHCLHDMVTCKHFSACQDERVFGGMKVSSRYGTMNGNCYDGGEDVRI